MNDQRQTEQNPDPAPAPAPSAPPRFSGKCAVVTGGARGIGRAHAVALAREGCNVVVGDILEAAPDGAPYAKATQADLDQTVRLVEACGGGCAARQMDVRDPTAAEDLVREAVNRFGRLDFLIANAAISIEAKVSDLSPAEFDAVVRTNLHGVFNVMSPAIRAMAGGGRIVVIGSGASRHAEETAGAYVASKWALIGLVKTAALECAKQGVTVNAVLPGPVDTAMMNSPERYRQAVPDKPNPTREDYLEAKRGATPMGYAWIKPEDVASTSLFLLSDEARFISGVALSVDAADCAHWT